MAMQMALPTIGMILAECAQVGLMLFSKAVMSRGMISLVFVFYSNALASLILLPSSFLFHRSQRPPISFPILCGFFFLGLLGCLAQIFGYAGIYYSSATLGTAMLNLIPGFTFILAVTLRMENLNLRNTSSLAKALGTIVSIGGAFIVTMYKGPPLLSAPAALDVSHQFHKQPSTWVIGGMLLAVDCIFSASFLILQLSSCSSEMEALLPSVAMVMAVLAQVVSMELNKAAMSRGTNKYVLIVYSNALASLILLPCSLIVHRSVRLPAGTSILFRLSLLALIGSASQLCGYAGIQYSSPALGTAMLNLIPAFTFILALTFRMEKVDLRSRSSQAKILGTLVSLSGALVATLYQGPPVLGPPHGGLKNSSHLILFSPKLSWIFGGIFLAVEAFTISAWYILQTMILRDFPAVLTVMFYLCFFNAALSAAYSLILVEDQSAWTPRPDIGLVAFLYHGIVATVFRISLASWSLSKVGPLFVSMFKPLGIIFAVVIGVSFLGETLFLGSLVGAAIIVCGVFGVLWGKVKEDKINKENPKSAGQKLPLLQNKDEEARFVG